MTQIDALLTERDRRVFEMSGQGARAGLGKRPALVVIDVSYAFCGDKDEPIIESVKRWRASCGHDAWIALPKIAKVIEAARLKTVPIIYTTGTKRRDGWDSGSWGWKNRRVVEDTAQEIDGNEIMPQVSPSPRDIVIEKLKPSAFSGTPTQAFLTQLGVDSLILVGCTTSGCVRATAVDAFSLNYRVSVVEDCCFDRYEASHVMSLFDMNAKYADVLGHEETVGLITALPSGLFDLPAG